MGSMWATTGLLSRHRRPSMSRPVISRHANHQNMNRATLLLLIDQFLLSSGHLKVFVTFTNSFVWSGVCIVFNFYNHFNQSN